MKPLFILFISVSTIILFSFSNKTQVKRSQIVGFWLVKNVNVGQENMTPVARWGKFNADHTTTSGNGWMQHTSGTWAFDEEKSELKILSDQMKDEFGAFKVSITKDTMIWERMEEGETVVVTLVKAEEPPLAPWDKILGFWTVESVTSGNKDLTKEYDPEDKRKIFIRWDRRITEFNTPKGRTWDYWYIHPHKPELYIIEKQTRWNISFEKDLMYWEGTQYNNQDNIKIVYKRTDS